MDVNLHVVTHIADEDFEVYNDDDDHRQNVSEVGQLMNLLERLKVDEEEDGVEQCAICLEEFGDGAEDSSGEIVRTNCSHVFHESLYSVGSSDASNVNWPILVHCAAATCFQLQRKMNRRITSLSVRLTIN
ncbi:hypothetical protein PIB30_100954 [Stylosanthes scabra]|uniref:RING-type domain-containing protein n=1 Tax=Stylosanthes scabra TaxID=79078 RepID=A0ABU6UW78_9FABA|nr:hypothetical protein [Stylosanthes scabra]